jgi:hypothetical protein
MTFTHYILTRYNVGLYTDNPYKVSNPSEWMKHRLELFKDCRESVLSQDVVFQWVIAVDENTPQEELDLIFTDPRMIMYHGNLKDVFNSIKPSTDWVITTRLDNDDTYNEGALEAIQEQFLAKHHHSLKYVIDIDYYKTFKGNDYPSNRSRANSPFLSLVEFVPKRELLTAFDKMHSYMPDHYKSIKIKDQLANMVIHDKNQCNKLAK